jgi:hypothetical protein
VFSRDPSRIPQVVFLTLIKNEADGLSYSQVNFVGPRGIKNAHVFKVLVHIDVVEDLLFYHYPREELLADGKVPWREFSWQKGQPDGEQNEDFVEPISRCCGAQSEWRRRDEEDEDRDNKRPRSHSILKRVFSWMEGRNKRSGREGEIRHGSAWYRAESSRGRSRAELDSINIERSIVSDVIVINL